MRIIRFRKALLRFTIFVFCFTHVLVPLLGAQNQPQTTPGNETGSGQTEPKIVIEDRSPRPGLSFLNGLSELRVPVGFAVGVTHVYAPDPASRDAPPQFTSVTPRLFTQFRRKGFQFLLDYQVGFSRYKQTQEHRRYDQLASLAVNKTISRRRLSVNVADQTQWIFNDGTFPNFYVLASATALRDFSGYAVNVYSHRQKIFRQSAGLNADYRLNKKGSVGVFAAYDMLRYRHDVPVTHGLSLGVRSAYQIRKWLSFDSTYSTYVATVDERLRTASIQRLQFGGFRYRLGRNTEAFTSVGIEHSRSLGTNYSAASFEAGLSRTSRSNQLSMVYHRGLSTAFGGGVVLGGSSASASFSQSLARRMSLSIDSAYAKGASSSRYSSLEMISAAGTLQTSLTRHMLFTTSYSHISQRAANLSFNSVNLHRYVVSAGLYYSIPDLLGRR